MHRWPVQVAHCGISGRLLCRQGVVIWVMGGVGDSCGAVGWGKSWDVDIFCVVGCGKGA